ncbi:MAG: amino acid adenylation domain-containing protein [Pyrinomonadaceae bacterium]
MSTSDTTVRLNRLSAAKRALLEKRLQSRMAEMAEAQTIRRRSNGEGSVPLSFAQQRLWFIDQLEPHNFAYNMTTALRLIGSLSVEALERCLNEIVRRHEALRTTFALGDEQQPVQVIAPELKLSLRVEDLSLLPEAEREAEAVRLATDEAQRPLDLAHGPLLRARLLRLGTEDHLLLFTMHHIISDGWSMGVLVREVGTIYSAYAQGEDSPLSELPIQYADYSVWQREWLAGAVLDEQLSYWKKQLGGDLPVLSLPTDHARPPVQSFQGGHELFALTKDSSDGLKHLSHGEDATLFMTLLAAFQVLLHRHTGQEDILIGAPIANRSRPETEPLIGFFVNTLVLRTDLTGNPTFRELLRRVQKMALGAYAHQDLPFEKLVEELHPERDLSRTPLVQIILALQNTPMGELELHGLTIQPQEFESDVVKFDLEFHLQEMPDGLGGVMAYNAALFEKETIRRLLEQFKTLLEGIVANPDGRITELPLLTSEERNRLLYECCSIRQDALPPRTIDELLAAQVERTNMQTYVLDHYLEPLPVGVAGELYLGGAGVARGYLNDAELTAEKFIPHPFSREGGERLYRTGDVARYRVDGTIEFTGRFEQQVKARGSRPERETPAAEFIAPRTPVEELLAKLWCEVLKVESVGINDNFFDLGGHSLLAMQLISRVRKSFTVDLPVRGLFESPTVAGLARRIEAATEFGKAASAQPLVPVSRENALPLSFAQQRLWFIHKLEPSSSAYNMPVAVRLKGRLDFAALEQTLSEIIKRHESLRTSFGMSDGQPVQIITPPEEVALPVLDLSHMPERERVAEAQTLATAEARQSFDLERGPLYRASLLRLDDEDHILMFSMHHIITDGWSMGVLVREVGTLYLAFAEGKPSPLAPLPIQYADFAHWQRKHLEGEALEAHLRYWKKQLGGTLPVMELPTDRPRPLVQSFNGSSQTMNLPASLVEKLNALARREGVTFFMLLLAAFKAMLYRYTGEEEIIIGSPIANRNREEIEGLIGFFVNTLVLRTDLSGSPNFRELLKRVRTVALEAYAHQDMPFEQLVEHLQPERSTNRHPLFQVMFQLENAPIGEASLPGLTLQPVEVERTTTQLDLSFDMMEDAGGLWVVAEYSTDLFDGSTIERLLRHFQNLLEGVACNEDARIEQLPLLTTAEREQLLVGWNDTAKNYPVGECLHELFEAQVKRTPERIAVEGFGQQLTYAELNSRANQLAHYLRKIGIGPEIRVGVLMERSLEMVTGLLAILKAGGAYVPLDPRYPKQRLAFMLDDAQASVLLTQGALKEAVPEHQAQVVCLDADSESITQESKLDPTVITTAEHLAYVIYTSGSTGQPKGVGVSHKSLVNHQAAVRDAYGLSVSDRVLQFASLSFDVAAEEIFPTLLSGATLVLLGEQMQGLGAMLLDEIEEQGVTVLNLPASAWHEWVGELSRSRATLPDCLRLLVVGSEQVSRESFAAWQEITSGRTRLLNAYGATETTITATLYQPDADGEETHARSVLPIGRPLANTQAYVLDRFLQPVPIGAIGELHIGGEGVARGYLNRPDLTAEKFIPDTFSREPGARLYRTGDLARYMPDGNLVFLGRADNQVKVRGFRIELGEIEAALVEHEAVRQAIISVRQDTSGHSQLVAYVVAERDRAIRKNELRQRLRERLPEFMVPSIFVLLDQLPLAPNGKVDARALPEPETVRVEAEDQVMPHSEVERAIATVWQEALRLEKVGVNENFFDLGGHSLLMVQIHNRLRKTLDANITILDLFKYPTISQLAAYIAPEQFSLQTQSRSFEVEARQDQARQAGEEIAIIGMAGRFPRASSMEQFWQNLADGVEAVSFFSDEELMAAGVDAALLNHPNYVKAGVLLDDIDLFDASFFGYSPREAEVMDPQHRIFLECAWEALERAGHDAEKFKGAIGVFAGAATGSYFYNLLSHPEIIETVGGIQLAIGNDKDHMPTHVSYKLNLRGPSVAVQTACSTSLVAVHMACRSLLDGECRMALAGGIALHSMEKTGYVYQEGGIGSPDGHCRAFDADAQGTISGSGVGIVVLKRLSDALADGDYIHAVIKGSAINNDGSAKVGYTAPSIEGQAEAIRAAQSAAGVDAETINYIEAHGTGTRLGDPIEIAALTQVFRERTSEKGFCAIGSLKTNLGHLDTAAGVASLIKTVLALEHRAIPPSLHFEQPNPALDLDSSPFYVNKDLSEWKTNGTPRRAGVSSFGIGGTNAHVIVEEAPTAQPSSSSRPWQLLMISAKTETALDQATANLAEYLKQHTQSNLADVAYTLQVGRKTFSHRRVVVCRAHTDAQPTPDMLDPQRVFTFTDEAQRKDVVFMFPGQGTQYVNMGLELYRHEPLFRAEVDQCCELLKPHIGFDLREILYPTEEKMEEAAARLQQTHVTQPALFVIEYALARVWMEWGVNPRAMIGHSIGEYVAACLAGVFSLEDALALVALRGRLIQSLPEGEMLSVQLPADELRSLLDERLSVAAINGPSLCVASGPGEAIDELQERLTEKGVSCRRLHTSHAFHSQMMSPVIAQFTEHLKGVKLNAPKIRYVSNVTGTWITSGDATDPDYWTRHLRQTVRFADGINELLKDAKMAMLEVGPGQTLSAMVRPLARETGQLVINSLRHPNEQSSDEEFLMKALGRLWLAGVRIDWQGFYAREVRRRLPLPTYPFERRRYWVEWQKQATTRNGLDDVARKKPDVADWFYLPFWKPSVQPRITGTSDGAEQSSVWLVFSDERGLSERLRQKLEQSGGEVIAVRSGERFDRLGERDYTISVFKPQDYEALVHDLKSRGKMPGAILHSLSVTAPESAQSREEFSERAMHESFYSLIFLARALGQHDVSDKIRITILSDSMQRVTVEDRIVPEKATILGPCKVIPKEYPNLTCRSIDVALSEKNSWQEERLIAQLASELLSDAPEAMVAYRANQRFVQAFEPVRLERVPLASTRLKEEGVYLITGGMGGIGLALAEHLAQTLRAKLVLVGRSAFPAKDEWPQWLSTHPGETDVSSKIHRVQAMENLGAEVMVASADVSNQAQMREALRRAREQFGKINGVIHAAGISPGGMIETEQQEMTASVLAPKVKGTRVLEDLFKDEQLDFLALFSSLSSILGVFGQVDYCAANAFLDAFAHYNIQQHGTPTVTINWDAWRDVGMAASAGLPFRLSAGAFRAGKVEREITGDAEQAQSLLADAISTAEGIDAFERILAHDVLPQALVSTRDLQSVMRQAEAMTQSQILEDVAQFQQSRSVYPRPNVQTAYVAPRNELEVQIAVVWQSVLGIEPVGVHDNFFDLGGHSLLATQLATRLRELFHAEIPLRVVFEHPTVAGLAEHAIEDERGAINVARPPTIVPVNRQTRVVRRPRKT